jgi:hypothetical protein
MRHIVVERNPVWWLRFIWLQERNHPITPSPQTQIFLGLSNSQANLLKRIDQTSRAPVCMGTEQTSAFPIWLS